MNIVEKIVVRVVRGLFLLAVVAMLALFLIPIGCAIGVTESEPPIVDQIEEAQTAQDGYIEIAEQDMGLKKTPSGNVYTDKVPMSDGYQCAMQDACRLYDVPYSLALGMAEIESHFDFEADSGLAWGIMQINPINYDWLLEEGIDATTYTGNIEAGVYMIGQLLEKYDVHKALMAYNCGEYGASRLWDEGYHSSQYSRDVVAAAERWEEVIG